MNTNEYIISKQINWAKNKGLSLIGSKGKRGRPTYTNTLDENLFIPLTKETEQSIKKGDGNELSGNPPKMQALHSSSALAVNVFQYWQINKEFANVVSSCGLSRKSTNISNSISFEAKYPIANHLGKPPNIDVVISNEPDSKHKVFAVECKFIEAYSGWNHHGLKPKYFGLDIWQDIPNLHKLGISLSPEDNDFEHLHPAQLIKHILGLSRAHGKQRFRLLYLWYNVLGLEGARHEEEIAKFSKIAKSDGVLFHSISYQELIIRLAKDYRDSHPKYIRYLSERYL